MALKLYGHPFSSYCQKAIMALYEREIAFELVSVDFSDPASAEAFRKIWPMAKMPVLTDEDTDTVLPESSVIIEYLDRLPSPAPKLIPDEFDAALDVRVWDRFLDNLVHTPMQRYVADFLRPADDRDPYTVKQSAEQLQAAYAHLDGRMKDREWVALDRLSMADCAAAPALYYAEQLVPIPAELTDLKAYYQRLMDRPSYRRILREAEPFFSFFPVGKPARMPA